MGKITKQDAVSVVLKITEWMDENSPFHFLYQCLNSELTLFKKQIELMDYLHYDEIENQVKTEFYKQI